MLTVLVPSWLHIERAKLKRNPFHPFATFDTAALSGLALGQTVLAKACQTANIPFDNKEAHSALYDTERTAELFCKIVNKWKALFLKLEFIGLFFRQNIRKLPSNTRFKHENE